MPQIGDIKWGDSHRKGHPQWKGKRYIWTTCLNCGKEKWTDYQKWIHGSSHLCHPCSLKIAGQRIKGLYIKEKKSTWRGGKRHRVGYIEVKVYSDNPLFCMASKDGYIREHRLVMAQKLNRPLEKGEMVHHLNGIRYDNRLENLGIVTHGNHEHNTVMKLLRERILDLEKVIVNEPEPYECNKWGCN